MKEMSRGSFVIICLLVLMGIFVAFQVVKRQELMGGDTQKGCAEVISIRHGNKGLSTRKTSIKMKLYFPDTSYTIIDDLTGYVDIDSTAKYLAICSTKEPGVCNIDYKSKHNCN